MRSIPLHFAPNRRYSTFPHDDRMHELHGDVLGVGGGGAVPEGEEAPLRRSSCSRLQAISVPASTGCMAYTHGLWSCRSIRLLVCISERSSRDSRLRGSLAEMNTDALVPCIDVRPLYTTLCISVIDPLRSQTPLSNGFRAKSSCVLRSSTTKPQFQSMPEASRTTNAALDP